jgi:hypothetical protein
MKMTFSAKLKVGTEIITFHKVSNEELMIQKITFTKCLLLTR